MDKVFVKLLLEYKKMFGESFPLMMVSQNEKVQMDMMKKAIDTKKKYESKADADIIF